MADFHERLLMIVERQQPMSVRQVFYAATVSGFLEKSEQGYKRVAVALADMRRDGSLPYEWLADSTRWMRKPNTHHSMESALRLTVETYRRDLWSDADAYVEIWLEKDALSGVIVPITSEYDVPLMVSRGYASMSFLHSAATAMAQEDRPCFIYHLGDHDPSGVNAGVHIERTLRELAPDADIHFERVAVTPDQIDGWNLPSRVTKKTDPRTAKWTGGDSVELDAIPAERLRGLVREVIERHLPTEDLVKLKRIEEAERITLQKFINKWPKTNAA